MEKALYTYRVHSEHDCRREADERRPDNLLTDGIIKHGDDTVEDHIDEVVRDRRQLGEEVVPAKREHREGPIRLVAPLLTHGGAPKVVEEEVLDWHVRPQVLVVPHGRHVVEDKVTLEGVPVDAEAREKEPGVGQTPVRVEP